MIVCSTPRCGGTIFCIELAKKHNIQFVGELSSGYIHDIGENYNLKSQNHETQHQQPSFTLDQYVYHLTELTATDKIYLVNHLIDFALPLASHYIITQNMKRAYISQSNYLIKTLIDLHTFDFIFELIKYFTKQQLKNNLLIRRFCSLNQKIPLYYEDMYQSKSSYNYFEKFPLRRDLEKFFEDLAEFEEKASYGEDQLHKYYHAS